MATRVRVKLFARTFTVTDLSVVDGRELVNLENQMNEWLGNRNFDVDDLRMEHVREVRQVTLQDGTIAYQHHYETIIKYPQQAGIHF